MSVILFQQTGSFSLIENVDSSDHTSVNNLISQFSSIIRNAGDPLFLKNCTINRGFNCKNSNTSKWFDEDCKNAKHSYKEALFNFNCNKSITNRTLLNQMKMLQQMILIIVMIIIIPTLFSTFQIKEFLYQRYRVLSKA